MDVLKSERACVCRTSSSSHKTPKTLSPPRAAWNNCRSEDLRRTYTEKLHGYGFANTPGICFESRSRAGIGGFRRGIRPCGKRYRSLSRKMLSCHAQPRREKRPPIYRTADPRRWAVGCAGNRDSALPGLSGSLIPAGYQLLCRQRFPGGIAAGSSPETARSLPAAPAGRGNTGAAIDRDPRKHCRPGEACCPSTVAGTGRKPRASSAPSLS